jgi:hypothetical protein
MEMSIEVEKVPFTDGCYDMGGAYWGGPDDLYCARGSNEEDGEVLDTYIRAKSRDEVIAQLKNDFEKATFLPENGSLYEQAIEALDKYLAGETDEACIDSAEFEKEVFEDRLREIKRRATCQSTPT